MKSQFNCRLDPGTLDTLNTLCRELGVSQADVVRLAVRLLARRELPKKPSRKTEKSA